MSYTHKFNRNGFYWLDCNILQTSVRRRVSTNEKYTTHVVAASDGVIYRCVSKLEEL